MASTTSTPFPTSSSQIASSATSIASSITSAISNAVTSPTAIASAAPSSSPPPQSGNTTSGSSPLLFFVALGFGVVFTNLWIIIGVKYCFRYNARNRQLRDENGDLIDLAQMPRQRRRREKKLMSLDEVNERFPITKYKTWVSSRADAGLSTAGGIDSSVSRPASIKEPEEPIEQNSESSSKAQQPATTSATTTTTTTTTDEKSSEPAVPESSTVNPPNTSPEHTATSALQPPQTQEQAHEDEEEEDPIQTAVPAEMLATPGDACAICIDTLEEDDDVRGLTCGHAFHASCVDPWLTSRRACCPLCKADYYVPKPRSEGEAVSDDRQLTRRPSQPLAPRDNLPINPAFGLLSPRRNPRPRQTQVQLTRFPGWMPSILRRNNTAAPPQPTPASGPINATPSRSFPRPRLPSFIRRNRGHADTVATPTPAQLESGTR